MSGETDFLEALIKHEAVVGRLYEAFAAAFPQREAFWNSLAEEERGHADKLRELVTEPAVNRWLLYESGLRYQAIKSSIGYVEEQTFRAQQGWLSSLQALSVARDLEDALLEEQFSRMNASIHNEVSSVLKQLAAETEMHRKLLAEALQAERQSGR